MDDYFRLGDFPWVENAPIMVDPTHYYPQIFQIIDEHLKQTHVRAPTSIPSPKINFSPMPATPKHFSTSPGPRRACPISKPKSPSCCSSSLSVIPLLSPGLIIRESKLSWTKEQRARLQASQFALAWLPLQADAIGEFVWIYNHLIWSLVRRSHGWTAPSVRGVPSPLE